MDNDQKTPPESLKEFCNRAAAAAATEGGARLSRLLRLLGMLGEPFTPVGEAAPRATPKVQTAATLDRVGIWERAPGDTDFVRRMDRSKEWNLWANLGRIEPKRGKRRVVFLGESVARGYLYDPLFTPAMVLQAILQKRLDGPVEVLDLARTDLGLEVGVLAEEVLRLEPDAVVIFAGNNWNYSRPQLPEMARLDAALRDEGVAGLKRFAEERLTANVRDMVGAVSSLYRTRGVPLVWVVPEFNLGDWRDPFTNAPHLPGTGNRDWLEHWQAAQAAFEAGDLKQAEERARQMTALDAGTAAAPLYLLAECRLRVGDQEGARRALEAARDAVIWDLSRNIAPRAYSAGQEALRSTAAEHGSAVADLPRVFREHLGTAIPDRRLFLDYCHLTAAGMRVAMAAAAAPVLRALQGADIGWRELIDGSVAPSPEAEADAAFLAAVHNAHWWQSRDVVGHYCAAAVQASPAIAEIMDFFLDVQVRRAPMLMCQAAEDIAALGSRQIQYYLLRYNYQQVDRVLVEAITGALLDAGLDPRERLEELRRGERSLAAGPVDLLDYYYASGALQPQEVMWRMPREVAGRTKENDFYKAYWIESRFVFAGEAGQPVRLRLTCRLPDGGSGAAVLSLNGRPQARLGLNGAWESWDLELPGAGVVEGLNELAVRWPLPPFPGGQALAGVGEDFAGESAPDFYPCFGEIHSFIAAPPEA